MDLISWFKWRSIFNRIYYFIRKNCFLVYRVVKTHIEVQKNANKILFLCLVCCGFGNVPLVQNREKRSEGVLMQMG